MANGLSFENLSGLQGLDYLVANSAEELKQMIDAIRLPAKIISVYSQGTRHYCWIQSIAKIKKVAKTKEK